MRVRPELSEDRFQTSAAPSEMLVRPELSEDRFQTSAAPSEMRVRRSRESRQVFGIPRVHIGDVALRLALG